MAFTGLYSFPRAPSQPSRCVPNLRLFPQAETSVQTSRPLSQGDRWWFLVMLSVWYPMSSSLSITVPPVPWDLETQAQWLPDPGDQGFSLGSGHRNGAPYKIQGTKHTQKFPCERYYRCGSQQRQSEKKARSSLSQVEGEYKVGGHWGGGKKK